MTTAPLMIVDDSDDDYEVIVRILKKGLGMTNDIVRFDNGADALKYLNRQAPFEDAAETPRPCVILLDLNMPGMNGHQVLTVLKGDADTRMIPVVVLTTSDNEQDIDESYARGANTFVVKPITREDLLQSMGALKHFWLDTAKLPAL
tara:strand:- start:476 stop:916 length:441 start_codon:yes stop_codon:yes gene_type:complete